MKISSAVAVVFWFWFVMAGAVAAGDAIPSPSPLFDNNNLDRLLLVAFKDRSINRIPSTASAYRKRGSYTSSTWSQRVSGEIAQEYHLQKLTEWPMTAVGVHCVVFQVPAGVSVADILARLAQDRRVDVAQNMQAFHTHADGADDPYFPLQANLHAMAIGLAHGKATGKEVKIAMIDTGVDLEHPDLAGQISGSENFAEGISDGFSTDKHGTAVAGVIIAKRNNGVGIVGVAPDSELLALKACWPDSAEAMAAMCNSYTLALAVNAAIRSGAQILNMSLSGPYDPLLALLLDKAIADGMIIVAADDGSDVESGNNFPASMDQVISVKSGKLLGDPSGTGKTNQAAFMAPGNKILTTQPYGTYGFISGSSIAAAEVTGTVALLLEQQSDLGLREIKSILAKSHRVSDSCAYPCLNADAALSVLCESEGCPSRGSSSNKLADGTIGATP